MKDGKKSKKKRYLDSYVKSEGGEYVYTGVRYRFDMPPRKLRNVKILFVLLALVITALYALAGFLNTAAGRTAYVVLPYAAMFLPIALMLADVYKIVTATGDMTQKQYDASVVQLRHVSMAVIVLSALTTAGDMLLILTGRPQENFGHDLLYLTESVMILVITIGFYMTQRRLLHILKINS